ncbi:MAG: hypothetical protein OXN16_12720 [Gammaproteobacteria bacterium]|nr:hypothetical protein [Gammaproteobacteria bacterium]
MIRVQWKQEYSDFDREIRQRGKKFLQSCPTPNSTQFNKHNYWKKALNELHAAYDGLCAYTSRELIDGGTVDHFKPKSKYPLLAYEWDNYRLARQQINQRKGNSEDVADPFQIDDGWFILDLPSCLIKPGNNLSADARKIVKATINTLQLNHDERLVEERRNLLVYLADDMITLKFLDKHYPFLSAEVKRQNVIDSLRNIFSRQ